VLAEGESADDAIEVAVRTLDAVRAAVCGRAGLESLIRVAESMVRRPSFVSVFLVLG
jgi:hypothetical protein